MQTVVIAFVIPTYLRGTHMSALTSYRTYQVFLSLLLLTALRCSWAQTPSPQITSSQARIAHDQELIRASEQHPIPAAQAGALWADLGAEYQHATEFPQAEDAYNRSLHLLKTAPDAGEEYAATLDNLAALYLIYGRVDDAESARKQALVVRQKLGDIRGIAVSHIHLADIALARHQFKKAEKLALQGMDEMKTSSSPPREGMLSGLVTATYARCSLGHCDEGLTNAEQAVSFANTHFEPGSAAAGFALETLGFAKWKSGATHDGEIAMVQGIQILRTKLEPADPRLAGAMLQYRAYLLAENRQAEAQEIHEQVGKMTRAAGVYCSNCSVSVNTLSKTLR
jgi:tetratricopeptide (TPR) repeat protein